MKHECVRKEQQVVFETFFFSHTGCLESYLTKQNCIFLPFIAQIGQFFFLFEREMFQVFSSLIKQFIDTFEI